MNEHDLERLVNLLSYLKKHDDVESEIQKRRGERKPPPGQREKTPWERTQSPGTFTSDPLGSTVGDPAKARGYSTAAGGSAGAYQTSTSAAEPNFPSSLPDPSTQEIRDRVSTASSERDYSEGPTFHTGERGGDYALPGEREVGGKQVEVVSPSEESSGPSMVEDPLTGVSRRNYNELPDDDAESRNDDSSDGADDWLNDSDTRDWLKENNINSLQELQDYIKDFVPKVAGPGDYSRAPEQVKKSTESILLRLLDRLGI